MKQSREILLKYWNYDSFRPQQEEIVDDAINGSDVLALLPTGGGKSICFQVPGIAREGITLVISPLIALMQDQVANLKKIGIRAEALTSGLSYREIDILLDNTRFGGVDFLYTSPERIQSSLFIERFKSMQVGLIVVDEAHCISEWGHDFRPSFMKIKNLREYHPKTPILALTATATEKVRKDIIEQLALKKAIIHEASFERKNVSYEILKTENKIARIIDFCKANSATGIIYCQTRKSVKEIARILLANSISSGFYHGGLENNERQKMLQSWLKEDIKIMVATNAFGMGIDKPNVRFVLHYELPQSLEAYFQEAGRCGRDGELARAIAFVEPNDTKELMQNVVQKFPEKEVVFNTYKVLCNYLNVAFGSGKDETYPIDLKSMCETFKLDYAQTYNSLKILELNENIQFSEGFFQPTKVKFLVDHAELYNFQVKHEKYRALTTLLSRSYSGIFDIKQNIFEAEIAKRIGISEPELKNYLEALKLNEIIDVNFRSSLPTVTFIQERVNDLNFQLAATIYHDRKKNAVNRVEKVLELVESEVCRAKQIINYFGQETSNCGICDWCKKNESKVKLSEKSLQEFLREERTIGICAEYFSCSENEINTLLRPLLIKEKISFKNGKYYLR